jgi:hypothetical protein
MLYTTLEKLKKFLGVDPTEDDTPYTELIEIATELIDTELGENLEIRTKTRRIDGSGTLRIIMENRVNSVVFIRDARTLSPYTLDFIDGAIVYLTSPVERGQKNIEISYVMGYAEVPKDFERYFLEYCKELRDNQEKQWDTEVVKTKKLGDLSITYFAPSELANNGSILASPEMQNILKKYKNFTIYPIV